MLLQSVVRLMTKVLLDDKLLVSNKYTGSYT